MSSKKIKLKIATPEKLILEEEVDLVTLPTKMGAITVLPDHIPLISELKFGELLAQKEEEDMPFAIWGGIVEIKDNQVIVLADVAEFAEDIVLDKVEQAKKDAEALMQKKGEFTEEDYADLLYGYEKHLAMLEVGKKYHSKKYRKLTNLKN